MTQNPDGGEGGREGGKEGRKRGRGRESVTKRRRKMGNISETESEIEERDETMEERKRRETLHCSLNELHLFATLR